MGKWKMQKSKTKSVLLAATAAMIGMASLALATTSRFGGRAALAVGEETTLTIKGSATQIETGVADKADVTSTLQGADANITVVYHMSAKETNSLFNNTYQEIRLYNAAGAVGSWLTITTKAGYSIKDCTVTWTNKNNGACNYASGTKNEIGKCSFNIENTGNSSGTGNG